MSAVKRMRTRRRRHRERSERFSVTNGEKRWLRVCAADAVATLIANIQTTNHAAYIIWEIQLQKVSGWGLIRLVCHFWTNIQVVSIGKGVCCVLRFVPLTYTSESSQMWTQHLATIQSKMEHTPPNWTESRTDHFNCARRRRCADTIVSTLSMRSAN